MTKAGEAIRVLLINGNYFDVVSPQISFKEFVSSFKLAGCVWLDNLYIPQEKILAIHLKPDGDVVGPSIQNVAPMGGVQ